MKKKRDYTIRKYPKSRRITSDLFSMATKHHVVHGLFEADVTKIREYIESEQSKGNDISFTGYILYCLVKAMGENNIFNSFRLRNRKLITFNDIDVSLLVEVEKNWKKVPLLYLMKSADKKSFEEINEEINNLKTRKADASHKQKKMLKLYFCLPRFIREMIIRSRYRNNPFFRRRNGGTACVSSLGMFSGGSGYGIPLSMFTVFLLIGGVEKKPIVVDDEIVIREMVSLTFTFDHDLIDGAVGSRLVKRVRNLIKDGYGLP